MKRQEYRQRKQVCLNVELSAWEQFQDLCDKEAKSYSLKLNEMILEEIRKNEIGETNPIKILYNNQRYISLKRRRMLALEIPLDRFMDNEELRKIVETVPNESYHKVYYGFKIGLEIINAKMRTQEYNKRKSIIT